ncbi:phage antirepressor KilAC domain-containing protein [Halobacillus karajensis]|uniref:Phage regulatory protein, Rha family n=1 Tax=Halobacillus karajensis TaxID=195088 RepID=A0A059NYJ6_9BACI|nr:phage regulatory protein/antirepressor Ant [Halobacillus karajensis]CDQ22552.1 phage regulatory protein, Rha family [Halobacillus karajensis]CDQ26034.1 phage regulatory protein, Rha family [Halobacillus karajensis]
MNELVFRNNGEVVTDSLTVAEVFDKEHKNVLKDIREMGCSEEFSRLNFKPSDYTNERGRKYTKFFITQDGFTLLVMGYTGTQAMEFKEKYIEEFNLMKKELQNTSKASYMIEDPIKRAQAWIQEQQEKQMLEQRVAEYEPKISYLDSILGSTDTVTTSQIAADYGMSANKLNKLLHEFGVQYKVNGQWLLYSKHKSEGYTKSKTTEVQKKDGTTKVVMNTRWRQKGRLFIYETLKKQDIFPLMDLEEIKKERPTG